MQYPLINITIPFYNRKRFASRAITNALQLDYPNKTITIVDDGSTDGIGEEIIKEFEGTPGLTYLKLTPNIGADSARNVSILLSKYDYITFHDSDDIYDSRKLKLQLQTLREQESVAVFNKFVHVDTNGQILVRGNKIRLVQDLYRNVVFENNFNNYILINPGLFDRSVFQGLGGFLPGRISGDDHLQYRLVTSGLKLSFIDQPLILKLDQPDSLTVSDETYLKSDLREKFYESLHEDIEAMRVDPTKARMPVALPEDLKVDVMFAADTNAPALNTDIPITQDAKDVLKEFML